MKKLILIRHAKSDWSNPFLDDFDRPLNDRGKEDAPEMANRLKIKNLNPQLVLSSPSVRTLSTAEFFLTALGIPTSALIEDMDLYHVTPDILIEVIQKHAKDHDVIMVFSHNPAITDFVNEFSTLKTDNVPTCGMVELNVSDWNNLGKEKAVLEDFDFPKKLRNQ